MWFLLTQIFFLLILAALFGAALMYWWTKSRYEDVTETHTDLVNQSHTLAGRGITRDDLKAEVAGLTAAMPTTDLEPLAQRLTGLEAAVSNFRIPEAYLDPLHARLARLEGYATAPDDSSGILAARISDMEASIASLGSEVGKIQNADLEPIDYRMAQLESAINQLDFTNDVDLGPVHSGLARVELALDNLEFPKMEIEPDREYLGAMETRLAEFNERLDDNRKSDVETLMIRMQTLSSSIAQLRMPDMDGVNVKLGRIETSVSSFGDFKIDVPEPNLDALHERLRLIENQLRYTQEPSRESTQRFSDIEDSIATVMSRLTHVSTQIGGIGTPVVNLEPIQDRMRSIETRLLAPNDDMANLYLRLSDLEAATASVHQKISGVETSVSMIDRTQVDLSPLQSRLIGLETLLGNIRSDLRSMPDMANVERRLGSLQEAFLGLREPDLAPLVSSIRSIESRVDFGSVENRLTSIEYGLAAMHDMLRRRSDAAEVRAEMRSETRSFVAEAPARRSTDARPRKSEAAPVERVKRERTETRSSVERKSTRKRRPKRDRAEREADAIHQYRQPDDQANLLVEAAFGTPDELEEINGVGPMLCALLHDVGVYYFWQVAEWGDEEISFVDDKLQHFRGRIDRDDWVGQAEDLADLPSSAQRP